MNVSPRIVEANVPVPDFDTPAEADDFYRNEWAALAREEAQLEWREKNAWRTR